MEAIASLVRDGAFLSDVGCDHAFLPIYLLERGKIRGAVASDVVGGPLSRARENIEKANMSAKIATELCPGLDKIAPYDPDDIVIAGMGGELIASIIDGWELSRDAKRRFILQPMTRKEDLRAYLSREGYEIEDELAIEEDSRIYTVMAASYTGKPYTLDAFELIAGRKIIEKALAGDKVCASLIKKEADHLYKIVASRSGSVKSAEFEKEALGHCRELLAHIEE